MKIGDAMYEPRRAERAEKEPGMWSDPYLHLSLGLSLMAATVMVVATAGVLAAGIGFVVPASIFLGAGVYKLQRQRNALSKPAGKERELLSAIRDNGGSISPAEAALETSLTVREADGMLSELAAGGHLMVESRNGAIFYALAGGDGPELEGRPAP